jgi:hypothetical protein
MPTQTTKPAPKTPRKITPELVQQVTERVWRLWQEQLRIERERRRQS